MVIVKYLLLLLGVVMVWLFFVNATRSQDRDAQKEALRLQFTEFCAVVKTIPDSLVEVVNEAPASPAKIENVIWLQRIINHWHKVGCRET